MRVLLDVVREGGGGAVTSIGRVENRILAYLRRVGASSPESGVASWDVARATKNSDAHGDVVRAFDALAAAGLVREDYRTGPKGGRPARILWVES